jgi:hypothetical protein
MKTLRIAGFLAAAVLVPSVYAQKGALEFPKPVQNNPPPKDYVVEPPPPPLATLKDQEKQVYVYDEKLVPGKPVLVTPEQAQNIINRFKQAYLKLGSPRFLIYVNRELIHQQSAMKSIQGTQTGESPRASTAAESTATDKPMGRDVERFFGRPLRDAGATLADQKAAAQVIGDKPIDEFLGSTDTPEARQDREALGKIADAVIEVQVSSRTVAVPALPESQTITVPEIQATAINLKDSKIIGQASSSDLTARVPPSTLTRFRVREITEATALALMQDMTPSQ